MDIYGDGPTLYIALDRTILRTIKPIVHREKIKKLDSNVTNNYLRAVVQSEDIASFLSFMLWFYAVANVN